MQAQVENIGLLAGIDGPSSSDTIDAYVGERNIYCTYGSSSSEYLVKYLSIIYPFGAGKPYFRYSTNGVFGSTSPAVSLNDMRRMTSTVDDFRTGTFSDDDVIAAVSGVYGSSWNVNKCYKK